MNALVKVEPAREAHMLPSNFDESIRMATAIAKSGLFGCKTSEQAFALMLLADAEGLHPAAAARDYHIIDGKPSLKADAMLARYLGAGGKIEWVTREPECVSAKFSHPSSGSLLVTWDKARATLAGFWGKATWKKHPIQMLSARVISEGVRASFPGVVSGVYTPEEVMDFEPAAPTRVAMAPAAPVPQEQPAQPEAEAVFVDAEPVTASAPSSVSVSPTGAPVKDYAHDEGLSEVDHSREPEWAVLISEMEAYSTREDLTAWWTTPEKKALKQRRPHLTRAFYRFAYTPRWEDLGETVQWEDEPEARV